MIVGGNMKKKKNHIVLLIIGLLLLILIIWFFTTHYFFGTVVKKYNVNGDFQIFSYKVHHVIVKTWYGKKNFIMNKGNEYKSIKIGKTYFFIRKIIPDSWIYLIK
jgi:SNF family Na+-dependent transporter